MENERPEFFKLDQIDQKVLFWLLDNLDVKSVKSWVNYIAQVYQENSDIALNPVKLYDEVMANETGL